MTELRIPIKTITKNLVIWRVFPGQGIRQLNRMLDESKVYLEMPGLNLNHRSVTDIFNIRQHTRMARALYDYHNGESPNPPSRNPSTYSGEVSKDKTLTSQFGNVKNLFSKAKTGDLVVVTGAGSDVSIGEISSDFDPTKTIQLNNRDLSYDTVQYREVRWLQKSVPRSKMPAELVKRIANRHAVSRMLRDKSAEYIFDFAYPSYFHNGLAKVSVFGPDYSGKKFRELNNTEKFLQLLVWMSENNNSDIPLDLSEFNRMLLSDDYDTDPNEKLRVELDFHSPGRILVGCTLSVAMFILAGVSLSRHPDGMKANLQNLTIVNPTENDPSTLPQGAKESIARFAKSLADSPVTRDNAEKLSQKAVNDVGMSVENVMPKPSAQSAGSFE